MYLVVPVYVVRLAYYVVLDDIEGTYISILPVFDLIRIVPMLSYQTAAIATS